MARILVVDDALFIRKTIIQTLTTAGHEVVGEASTGTEAVHQAKELQPDLVILDINMPEMNGVEALERLQQQATPPRVLICSALAEGPQVDAARSLGGGHFLRKPFDPEDLVAAVILCLASPVNVPAS